MITTLLSYLVIGSIAGLLAGLFGIGGGLIMVPILIISMHAQGLSNDVATHLALGTSLSVIIFTSINAARTHNKRGSVRWDLLKWLAVGMLVGCIFGAQTAKYISGPNLQKIIGVFAICMALKMIWDANHKRQFNKPEKQHTFSLFAIAGVVIGWASSIFGIGGGSLTVPFLTSRGLTMQQAVGTSAASALPIALFGTFAYIWAGYGEPDLPKWSLGYIYLPALIGLALMSSIFAVFGAKLAYKMSSKVLTLLFALMLICVGLTFLLGIGK